MNMKSKHIPNENWSDFLCQIGFPKGRAFGRLKEWLHREAGNFDDQILKSELYKLKEYPEEFLDDPEWGSIAYLLREGLRTSENIILKEPTVERQYSVFGLEYIETGAIQQMDLAMRLPVAIAGALLPDAHQGYGLPIGGVLATKNAVIPYGVGVDIGCRMALSIFDCPAQFSADQMDYLSSVLQKYTVFGAGKGFESGARSDHAVLSDPLFGESKLISSLKDKAWTQLGSSGGGNHFVEFGSLEVLDHSMGLNPGCYLALLSHSGSRGLGASIANHFTKLAKELCPLPGAASNLSYLDLDSAEGQEYWSAMQLAGAYASACHELIHQKIKRDLKMDVIFSVENHHNFAWKEVHSGEELIVHRKGATPAGQGVLGFIPGSMSSPGYVVRGKGHTASLFSAAHGAGRLMSRTQAIKNLKWKDIQQELNQAEVRLIGGGLDEAPAVYKNINDVMAAQAVLVDCLARFNPRVVRMSDDGSRED